MKNPFSKISVRPLGGATLSRLAPTKSARQGEPFTPLSVPISVHFDHACDDFSGCVAALERSDRVALRSATLSPSAQARLQFKRRYNLSAAPARASSPHFSHFPRNFPGARRLSGGASFAIWGSCGLKQNRQAVLRLARASLRATNAETNLGHGVASLTSRG